MKIYISGAISGLTKEEYEANFSEAEKMWQERKGYEPISPVTHCAHLPPETSWSDYMIEDIRILLQCPAMYMLRNWKQSKGARIEHAIGIELSKQIFYQQ